MVEQRGSVSGYDSDRLSSEVESYQEWLDLRTQEVYLQWLIRSSLCCNLKAICSRYGSERCVPNRPSKDVFNMSVQRLPKVNFQSVFKGMGAYM